MLGSTGNGGFLERQIAELAPAFLSPICTYSCEFPIISRIASRILRGKTSSQQLQNRVLLEGRLRLFSQHMGQQIEIISKAPDMLEKIKSELNDHLEQARKGISRST